MEKTFRRWFPTQNLTSQVLKKNPWFGDLLTLWRPSGTSGRHEASSSDYHLRLAVRDGYLNFYRAGRSLALVRFGSGGELKAKIHNKFIFGEKGSGQSYVTLTSKGLLESEHGPSRPYGGMKMMRSWIHNACAPHQYEKLFVDSVIAQNANIIDVEMALPAFLDAHAKRKHTDPEQKQRPTAPRMDLVALEHSANGWELVFWEAKLISNGEAKSEGDTEPRVIEQLGRYTAWLRKGNHVEVVRDAYRTNCRILVALREIAKRYRSDIEALGDGVLAVGALGANVPELDEKPRILVDARKPDTAFVGHGHLKKLRGAPYGFHVQMIEHDAPMVLDVGS